MQDISKMPYMYHLASIPLKFVHIGVVVRDADAVSKTLYAGLGLGPWTSVPEWKTSADEMMVGEPLHLKVNTHNLQGGMQLAICQPLSKDPVMARFLEDTGGGIHHICFEVARQDFDRAVKAIHDQGGKVLSGALNKGSRWCLIETGPGGLILEFMEPET